MRSRTVLLCCFVSAAAPFVSAQEALGEKVRTLLIEGGELSVLFRDNSRSVRLLSGVDSLFNLKDAPAYDAFDPDNPGASAGLNFEHIIAGHADPCNRFTPRYGRYALHKLAGGRSAVLVREEDDGPWAMSNTFKYTVNEPHFIDFEFRCVPHDASLFGKHGWAILFFADYMNDVAEVPLHFRGIEAAGSEERWIAADGPKTHPDWNGGGTYRHADAPPLDYDADHDFKLNVWSYDWPRYTKPFYFGKAARDMAFILMFDRDHSPTDEIRFSIFKFKLNKSPRPAWDFQYVIHKVEAGKEYAFRGRLVWKRFVSPEDCLAEYESWRKRLGAKPGGDR